MSRTEDSMADSIAGIGFVDEHRDIDDDFAIVVDVGLDIVNKFVPFL